VLAISHPSIAVPLGVRGMPHIPVGTVSLADVSTSFGIQISTGNIRLHAADLIPNCAKHYLFAVNATCVPPVPCFLLLDVQLIAKYAKH